MLNFLKVLEKKIDDSKFEKINKKPKKFHTWFLKIKKEENLFSQIWPISVPAFAVTRKEPKKKRERIVETQ